MMDFTKTVLAYFPDAKVTQEDDFYLAEQGNFRVEYKANTDPGRFSWSVSFDDWASDYVPYGASNDLEGAIKALQEDCRVAQMRLEGRVSRLQRVMDALPNNIPVKD